LVELQGPVSIHLAPHFLFCSRTRLVIGSEPAAYDLPRKPFPFMDLRRII